MTSGTIANASSTAFPGRTSASRATPSPTSAKRPTVGANVARTTRSAQSANAAANTGSLESSWNISAYPWYRSSAAATAIATQGPKYRRSGRPADDRARVQERHDGLREPSVRDVEDTACEERRHRRPEQERPRQEHVVVEELDVREEVLVEVATGLERPGERTDGVRDESRLRRGARRRAGRTRAAPAGRGSRRASGGLPSRGRCSTRTIASRRWLPSAEVASRSCASATAAGRPTGCGRGSSCALSRTAAREGRAHLGRSRRGGDPRGEPGLPPRGRGRPRARHRPPVAGPDARDPRQVSARGRRTRVPGGGTVHRAARVADADGAARILGSWGRLGASRRHRRVLVAARRIVARRIGSRPGRVRERARSAAQLRSAPRRRRAFRRADGRPPLGHRADQRPRDALSPCCEGGCAREPRRRGGEAEATTSSACAVVSSKHGNPSRSSTFRFARARSARASTRRR